MATRGRKPKAAAIKRTTGNPGNRPILEEVPFGGLSSIAPPRWMNKWEKEEWDRIVPELVELGIAKSVNEGALQGICTLYAQWRKARKERDQKEMRLTYDAYRKALNEFGLTAASAARVGGTGANDDPAERFFTGPRAVK